ncbi:MAG: ferredoxin [Nanoarchaeota archaeon]|nr:ferredoxin [Nanoarchaeota archaeon]MBU1269979.1 ferredoxin [Nanoarchaeota archaeon]MBU1604401.1 ferredoxin [Nanoarchaeota archaeon]MBU2442577.1 ferredoxin [Nanoarchaeota archaeon]
MKKVRVVYDRERCISAVTCVHLNPENWVMNRKDAKADLKGSKKEGDKWILETEMTRYLQMAAEQCPAQVIEVYDLKTGKKLF